MFKVSVSSPGLNLTHPRTTGHSIQPWICNQYTSRQYTSVNPQYTPRQSVSPNKSVYHQYTCCQYISVYNQYAINSTLPYTLSPPEAVSIRQYTISTPAVSTHQYTISTQWTLHFSIPSVYLKQSVYVSIPSVHISTHQYTISIQIHRISQYTISTLAISTHQYTISKQ